MKKLLALALALFLLPAVAFSEDVTDLEAFFDSCTFEELMNLNRVVQLYLFKKSRPVRSERRPGSARYLYSRHGFPGWYVPHRISE